MLGAMAASTWLYRAVSVGVATGTGQIVVPASAADQFLQDVRVALCAPSCRCIRFICQHQRTMRFMTGRTRPCWHIWCVRLVAFRACRGRRMGGVAGCAAQLTVERGIGFQLIPLFFMACETGGCGFLREAHFARPMRVFMTLKTGLQREMRLIDMTLIAGGDDFPLLRWMPLVAIHAGNLCFVGKPRFVDIFRGLTMAKTAMAGIELLGRFILAVRQHRGNAQAQKDQHISVKKMKPEGVQGFLSFKSRSIHASKDIRDAVPCGRSCPVSNVFSG